MQEDLFVRSDVYVIKIRTNSKFLKEYITNKIDDFSRLTINTEIISSDYDADMTFIYNDIENYNIKYNKKEKEMILDCPWNRIDKSTVIPMMFRIMVEILRQNNNEIKLHSSAIEKNNKVALILAPSEGGKTTTALSLCQNYNCIMRANDASVVKQTKTKSTFLRGDTSFRFRLNGLKAYSENYYKEKTNNKNKSDLPWYDKLKVSPEELNIVFKKESTNIKYIIFVKLDALMDGFTVKKYNSNYDERSDFWLKYKMQILSNIGGTIKGNDLIPLGNDGTILPLVVPDFDNKLLAKKRIKFINNLFEQCEVYQLRGQLDGIADYINNLL